MQVLYIVYWGALEPLGRALVVPSVSRLAELGARMTLVTFEKPAELERDGFVVERPAGGHAAAPAVVVRWSTGRPGPTLQFDGHLDTVHLPFVAPKVDGDLLRGTGASDMKAGVAAAVEALRIIRQTGLMPSGDILFVAHDLHEAPWGLGQQLDQLISQGYVGDAVLIPESHWSLIHVIGRGAATWKVRACGGPSVSTTS